MFDAVGKKPRQMRVFGTSGDDVICEDWGVKEFVKRDNIIPVERTLGPGDTVYVWADGSYHLGPEGN